MKLGFRTFLYTEKHLLSATMLRRIHIQWNLSIKYTLNKGHLSIQNSKLVHNGVRYREVPL